MSSRRINVDLGPLTLSLLESNLSELSQPPARREDIKRLQSIMRQSTGAQGDDADRIEADDATFDGDCASFVIGAPGLHGSRALDDANIELLEFELSAAVQITELKRTTCSSEIRLALRPGVLREAELIVIELEATLEFSILVGNEDDCRWLAEQLPRLALTLGEKLQRRLRLRLFGVIRQQLIAEQAWPSGVSA